MTTSAVKREQRDAVYAAFIEGCYARLLGEELPACPYTARTAVADSWELGWERTDDLPKVNEPINIIFDGPPSHESGRFVETELDNGTSVKSGEWIERPDGLWALRITALPLIKPSPSGG